MSGFQADLVARLVAEGVAVENATLFQGSAARLPADKPAAGTGPAPFLVVTAYGGQQAARTHNAGAAPAYEKPRAQVQARGWKPTTVWALAQAAYEALQVANATLSGTWYLRLGPMQPPFDMGLDDSGRLQVGFNVEAEKRPAS